MAIFSDFLRPVFSASRVQQVSDLHSKFTLSHTMCGSMQPSNLRRLRIGEEKKKEERRGKKKPQDENIMVCMPYSIGRP